LRLSPGIVNPAAAIVNTVYDAIGVRAASLPNLAGQGCLSASMASAIELRVKQAAICGEANKLLHLSELKETCTDSRYGRTRIAIFRSGSTALKSVSILCGCWLSMCSTSQSGPKPSLPASR
jgi:hypothetical protein